MIRIFIPFFLVLMLIIGFTYSCVGISSLNEHRGLIVASILPQKEFIESIVGDKWDILIMVPPGADPHTYEPSPSQIKALSNAKAYFKVGSGLEFEIAWMDKLSGINRNMQIVDCSKGINLIEDEDIVNGGIKHGQKIHDPHIWLSLTNAKQIIANIYQGLCILDIENQSYFLNNRDIYIEKLDALDIYIRQNLDSLPKNLISYHPGLTYFAREYGLKVINIEKEGKEPSAADIANIIDIARKNNIKVVIISPQFNPNSAKIIAKEINAKVVALDILAPNFITNLQNFIEELLNI